MIIKIIGAVIFIAGGFLLGNSIEKKYLQQVELWQEIVDFLTNCQSQISYIGATIDEICTREREKNKKYSVMIADTIQYNTNVENLSLLADFAKEIRSVDLETQSKVFSFYRREAEKKMEEAKNALQKNGKTYQKLLPILSIGVAVLLW